jgi:hypothetical protein
MANRRIVLIHQDTASPEHFGEGDEQGDSSRHCNRVDQAIVGIAVVRAHGARALQQPRGAFAGGAENPRGVQRVPGN